MSRKLTIEQEEEIRVLYRTGDYTMDALAAKFDTSKSSISRTVNRAKIDPPKIKMAPPPKEDPSPQVSTLDFTYDPIQFRIQKFQEIALSILNVENRGNNPATLHKLQIELHDQITEKIREQNGGADIENEEELLLVIQQAVIGLPPLLKDRLIETLSEDYGNVVPLEKKG
jgi:hypothetical protein